MRCYAMLDLLSSDVCVGRASRRVLSIAGRRRDWALARVPGSGGQVTTAAQRRWQDAQYSTVMATGDEKDGQLRYTTAPISGERRCSRLVAMADRLCAHLLKSVLAMTCRTSTSEAAQQTNQRRRHACPPASRCTPPKCLSCEDAVEPPRLPSPACRPRSAKPHIPALRRDSSTTHSLIAPSLALSRHGRDALPPVAQDACPAVSAATPPPRAPHHHHPQQD